MATATAVLNNLELWQPEFYESLSLAARLSMAIRAVRTHGQNLKMSYWLWKVNRIAVDFFLETDDILSGKKKLAAATEGNPSPEKMQETVDNLMRIGSAFAAIYDEARRKRLLNNSLIAGPVSALRTHADQFFELAEWIDMASNPSQFERVFAEAREQRARGEVYDLSQV